VGVGLGGEGRKCRKNWIFDLRIEAIIKKKNSSKNLTTHYSTKKITFVIHYYCNREIYEKFIYN
jgi:hypothetical protein